MKTSTFLKTLSAVGILGTAVFSLNANAEGGCPNGSYPQRGNGWQTCIPIPNYGGNDYNTPAQPRHDLSKTGALTFAINPKNDRVFVAKANLDTIFQAEKQVVKDCKADGGGRQCLQVTPLLNCAIVYKQGNSYHQVSEMTLSETQKLVPANARILYQGCS